MDEIEKAARESKPLTDDMVRAEGLRQQSAAAHLAEEEKIVDELEKQIDPVKTGGKQPDPECSSCRGTGHVVFSNEPDNHNVDCDCYTRPRKAARRRKRLAELMTCIKITDPNTFKPSWGLWADGIEILQLNPEAVQDLTSEYNMGSLPPELSRLILWMEGLAEKRAKAPDVAFADGAALAGGIVNARAKQGAGEVVPNG